MVFCCLINRHVWKTTSTSSLDFFKLTKNAVFGKTFMLICSFIISYIDSFIVGRDFLSSPLFVLIYSYIHSLQLKVLSFFFILICSFVLIHSLIHSLQVKQWKIPLCLFLSCIDSFIPGTAFIFMFICSYVLIHSLIHSFQVK